MNIQWYPGHMTKALRDMQESINLVDIIIEILDARVPFSSQNPNIKKMAANKKHIIVLNKSDLSNELQNKAWKAHFEGFGYGVVITDSATGKGIAQIIEASRYIMADKIARQKARGRLNVPIRAMIAGIPNVGKSTIINKAAKRAIAKVEDRPGVTRAKKWIKIASDFELLDTPGVLWPKFDNQIVGINLSLIGSINDNILNLEELAMLLIDYLLKNNQKELFDRYKLKTDTTPSPHDILIEIGKNRGHIVSKHQIDIKKSAIILLDEFRAGILGKFTLEHP